MSHAKRILPILKQNLVEMSSFELEIFSSAEKVRLSIALQYLGAVCFPEKLSLNVFKLQDITLALIFCLFAGIFV